MQSTGEHHMRVAMNRDLLFDLVQVYFIFAVYLYMLSDFAGANV